MAASGRRARLAERRTPVHAAGEAAGLPPGAVGVPPGAAGFLAELLQLADRLTQVRADLQGEF